MFPLVHRRRILLAILPPHIQQEGAAVGMCGCAQWTEVCPCSSQDACYQIDIMNMLSRKNSLALLADNSESKDFMG